MKIIKNLFLKYKELIVYVIFGGLTTVVNLASFYMLEALFGNGENSYLINNAIAWFIAVIFAYVTNKLFVFESRSWDMKIVGKEVVEFFGARVFSFLIEEAGLWLFVDILDFGKLSYKILGFNITGGLIAKLILAVIVVILNYFFSKFVIFKKKNNPQKE